MKKKAWEHEPDPATSKRTITIFYKINPTRRYIEEGVIKPDIVIWNKEEKAAKIIDVTVPSDFDLNRAKRQKITKYKELKNDLKNTWELKEIGIIPVVVEATGLVKKNLRQYLHAISSFPSINAVQIAAIKGTVTTLKRDLGYKASGA
ncbi:uncharacterized protein [Palaemon carinicauda]|uniref:uncharacterized protein n=1 Tax=Palaemon carinicauda TaxID=392227 RepID=UPI0035B67203